MKLENIVVKLEVQRHVDLKEILEQEGLEDSVESKNKYSKNVTSGYVAFHQGVLVDNSTQVLGGSSMR